MKAVVLCAGYATRLYPFTINEPKALLKVDGSPLLSYTIKKLQDIEEIDKIYVVTNNKFYNHFIDWAKKENSNIEIINDNTLINEDRLGGVMDMALALEKAGEDDILVLLGDNYFNFNFKNFIDYFKDKQTTCIALHDIQDRKKARAYGIAEIKEDKITRLQEKPEDVFSTLITTGCYIFPKSELEEVWKYINSDKRKEGPTYIIEDFVKRGRKVGGYIFNEDWYDIGTIEDYEKIKKEIKELEDERI